MGVGTAVLSLCKRAELSFWPPSAEGALHPAQKWTPQVPSAGGSNTQTVPAPTALQPPSWLTDSPCQVLPLTRSSEVPPRAPPSFSTRPPVGPWHSCLPCREDMGLTVRSTWAPLGSDRWTQSPGPSSHIPVQTLIFLREASSPRAPNTFGQPHCPCRVLPEPHFVLPPISEGCARGPVSQCTSLISPPQLPPSHVTVALLPRRTGPRC